MFGKSPVKPSQPGDLFLGRLLITKSISLIMLPLSHWIDCNSLYFSRNWSISSNLSGLCVQTCSQYCLTVLFMSSLILVICVLPRGLPVDLFEEPVLYITDFFFFLFSVHFFLLFVISFLLLALGLFYYLFLGSLGGSLDY